MKYISMLLFLTMFALNACHSEKEGEKLKDVQWVLETLNGDEIKLTDPEKVMFIQFDMDEKRVNGRAACNRFFGNFELDHSKLKFSPMGATRMACADSQKEADFFQMLEKVDSYSLKDTILSFLSQEKVLATFRKMEKKDHFTK